MRLTSASEATHRQDDSQFLHQQRIHQIINLSKTGSIPVEEERTSHRQWRCGRRVFRRKARQHQERGDRRNQIGLEILRRFNGGDMDRE